MMILGVGLLGFGLALGCVYVAAREVRAAFRRPRTAAPVLSLHQKAAADRADEAIGAFFFAHALVRSAEQTGDAVEREQKLAAASRILDHSQHEFEVCAALLQEDDA